MPLTSLAGNHALKEQLLPRLAGGKLGHALILTGPKGSGKHALAAILARAMVCSGTGTKPCGTCPACKKALTGIHPDIITIRPESEKKAISVDQVREMRADAHIRPNEAPRKVYILELADEMNDSAQNAMLKLLEEGPAYAAFLLIAENPGGLLITVRSRCETLSLVPARQEEAPEDETLLPLAREMTQLWLAGKEAQLMEHCVPMEKWERQQFVALSVQMTACMAEGLMVEQNRRRLVAGMRLLDQLRQAAELNVNAGTLAGWLCAACGE